MSAADRSPYRVLIYSHDSFGLGHLRRCREIAHALVAARKDVSVLIISGSPIIGSFDFRARVDFVRVPGVIKLRNGAYTPLSLHMDIDETLKMRQSIIHHTARIFAPDLLIVDKEPLGLRGEIRSTLTMLKKQGTTLILGLRDVLDDPDLLVPEWQRKKALPVLRDLYDEIWVYGGAEIYDPLEGVGLPESVLAKRRFTGFLRRSIPQRDVPMPEAVPPEPFLLVTAGGGGDGAEMMDWVLSAYESGATLPWPALLALGPFMAPELKEPLIARARASDQVRTLTFDAYFETIMARAAGVVAMGGYNTFCEILSFDRKAIMVPRTRPRREQLIRAQRAENLGLARMLNMDEGGDTARMIEALRALPDQLPPSSAGLPELLDGHETALARVDHYLSIRPLRRSTPESATATDNGQDNPKAEPRSSKGAAL